MSTRPTCICGSEPSDVTAIGGPRFSERALYGCRNCGLVQLWPWPADGAIDENLYQDEAYLQKIPRREYFGYWRVFEEYLRECHGLRQDAALLDFGAGRCWYQRFFLDAGYAGAQSLEINRHLVRYGREVLGLDRVHVNASELAVESFDIVVSNQVFEHLPDPIGTLQNVIGPLVKPGGLVVFSVPNWAAWNRLVLRQRWLGYSPQDHLWFFDRDSLAANLRRAPDFEVVDMAVRSAAGKPYDGFRPNGILKRLYYGSVWRLFEALGHGDQLIAAVRKCTSTAKIQRS